MRVIWLCPKPEAPSGGVHFIHQCCRLLDLMGIESYVLQSEPFDCWWSAVPCPERLINPNLSIRHDDIVIVPEMMWPSALPGVHFNYVQNYSLAKNIQVGDKTIAVSEYVHERLVTDGHRPTALISPCLESGVWRRQRRAGQSVLIYTRRNNTSSQVAEKLRQEGYSVCLASRPMTQQSISDMMDFCGYYIHLTTPEGFPAAVLEAMRKGLVVIGLTGGGGEEFMRGGENCIIISESLASAPAQFIADTLFSLGGYDQLREAALLTSLTYTVERTMRQLWDFVLSAKEN